LKDSIICCAYYSTGLQKNQDVQNVNFVKM